MHDLALHQERATEAARGGGHIARCHQGADARAGHGLALELHEGHDAGVELRVGGEHGHVAPGAPSEAEVLPHRHLGRAELLHQDLLDELLGVLGREVVVERDHDQLLDSEAGDQIALGGGRVEQLGQRVRVEHRERMGLEGEHGVGSPDHLTMADVDAVEGPDGHVAGLRLGFRVAVQVGQPGDLHVVNTTTGFIRPASGLPIGQKDALVDEPRVPRLARDPPSRMRARGASPPPARRSARAPA